MSKDIKIAQAVEIYESQLYDSVKNFARATLTGNSLLAMHIIAGQTYILEELARLTGKANTARLFSHAWQSVITVPGQCEADANGWIHFQ